MKTYKYGSYKEPYTRQKERQEVLTKKREYQRVAMLNAERHEVPIEDWEIKKFIQETRPEEKNIDVLYLLALEFKRTLSAMFWWYSLAYNSNGFDDFKTHAKDLIKRFEKIKEAI